MKTMKVIIMSACLGFGLTLASCDDDELIAPNNMTSGSATKLTTEPDTVGTGTTFTGVVIGGTSNGGSGNGNGGNGNGNGNGGGTGITGP